MVSFLFKLWFLSTAALLAFTPHASGKDYDPKLFVVGGNLEDKYNVGKYTVSIQMTKYIKKYFGYFHKCGGSIIGKKKILTAAHCLLKYSDEKHFSISFVVVVGIRNRFKKTSRTRIMHIDRMLTHEGFSFENKNTENDIGLVFTKENIVFDNDMIAQIGLPVAPVVVDKLCAIAGWGRVFHNGPLPAEMNYAEVRIFPSAKCELLVGELYSSKLFCAGDATEWGRDSCQGDSGGPLICDGTLVGVVSAGFECGSPQSPGMYTDVYQYLKWIESRGESLALNWLFILLVLVNV